LRRVRNLDGEMEKVPDPEQARILQTRSRLIILGAFLSALLLTAAVWVKLG
jgi:hypothetical protein